MLFLGHFKGTVTVQPQKDKKKKIKKTTLKYLFLNNLSGILFSMQIGLPLQYHVDDGWNL